MYYHWRKILDLSEGYPAEAVQKALGHCLDYRAFSYSSFRNVLGKLNLRKEIDPAMVTICNRCRTDLAVAVNRPLAYYEMALSTVSNKGDNYG